MLCIPRDAVEVSATATRVAICNFVLSSITRSFQVRFVTYREFKRLEHVSCGFPEHFRSSKAPTLSHPLSKPNENRKSLLGRKQATASASPLRGAGSYCPLSAQSTLDFEKVWRRRLEEATRWVCRTRAGLAGCSERSDTVETARECGSVGTCGDVSPREERPSREVGLAHPSAVSHKTDQRSLPLDSVSP